MATKEPSKDQAEQQARARAKAKEQTAAEERAQQMPKHGPEAEGEHPPGYDEAEDVNAIPSSSIELPRGQEPDDEHAPPVGLPQTVEDIERERITREEAERETAQREVLEAGSLDPEVNRRLERPEDRTEERREGRTR